MFETLADTRSLIDSLDTGIEIDAGSGNVFAGVFDQDFDDSLDITGRRSALRVANDDAELVTIDASITVKNSYTGTVVETDYIVRAKQIGQRTTLMILEQT